MDEKLIERKNKLEKDKINKAVIEGEIKSKIEELNSEFDCDSLDKAEKLLEDLSKEIDELEDTFKVNLEELDNDYNWDD